MDRRKKICLDFDGVVNSYKSGWNEGKLDDPPVEGAISWLRMLLNEFDIVIHSARLNDKGQEAKMKNWLRQNGLEASYVDMLDFKAKPIADWYVDDNAIRFDGAFPSVSKIRNTVSWAKREK